MTTLKILRLIISLFMLTLLASCSLITTNKDDSTRTKTEVKTAEPLDSETPVAVEKINWPAAALEQFLQGNELRSRDAKMAIQHFQRAIDIAPTMGSAYYNLMHLLLDQKDYTQLEALDKMLESAQLKSAPLLNLLAVAQREQGHFQQAEAYYMKALLADPNHLASLANMAILQDIYLRQLALAKHYYEQYQTQLAIQQKEDKRVKNWLIDLQQRLNKEQAK